MTAFIPAYDVENIDKCLPVVRQLVALHREYDMPGTLFIVGRLLEAQGKEFADLIGDDPLFEVASHTYSHKILRDHPFCGKTGTAEEQRHEIVRGVELVEETFGCKCRGLRPGCGFIDGFQTAPHLLDFAAEAGLDYVSSQLWGPDYTLPAPLVMPYTYAEQGKPALWEIPGHGWHDNVLKLWKDSRRIVAWPPVFPEAVFSTPVETPLDELAINQAIVDTALARQQMFVSLVWHPWSLGTFDPQLIMVRKLFEYVQQRDFEALTYAALCDRLQADVAAKV